MNRHPRVRRFITAAILLGNGVCVMASQATLVAAVLPTSRSAQIGVPVTVFATQINAGTQAVTNCRPALGSAVDVSLNYRTTDAATNVATGALNTPVTLAAGGSQSWVLELTANAEVVPTDVVVDFFCDGVDPAATVSGVNTIAFSASALPTVDMVALSATQGGVGVLQGTTIAGAAFSVASINVGSAATVTVAPVVRGAAVDGVSICQTNPATGQCLATAAPTVEIAIAAGATPTFSVFVSASNAIEFLPAENRIFVEFREAGLLKGATSVAVRIDVDAISPPTPTTPTTGRNILLVISDDQGLDASAQYPLTNDAPVTPTLNGLAAQGIVFDNVWATPACATTRATLLTGEYGINNGVTQVPGRLEPGTQTVQALLGDNSNYATGIFGKWHVGGGDVEATHPNDLGADYFAGNLVGNIDDYYSWDLTVQGVTETVSEYHTSKITDLAIDWIADQSTPWFAWVAYSAPHSPFHLPPAELQSSGLPGGTSDINANRRAYYLAAIEAMDTEAGRLLDSLPAEVAANTLVVFVGDNGTGRQVIDTQVYDGLHAKNTLYQGGVAVPMVVSGAGVTRQGERDAALITTTDFYATIAEVAGVSVAPPTDSTSFADAFSSTDWAERNYAYAEIEGVDDPGWTVRNATHKLIVFNDGSEALFELANDPDEAQNLLPGDASLTALRDELAAFGAMTRGEAVNPGNGDVVDITDALLTRRTANCAEYVSGYRADALDVNNDVLFEGDLVISVVDNKCVFTTNLIPNHAFNDGAQSFANTVSPQDAVYSIPVAPAFASSITPLSLQQDDALLLNGVKVDQLAAGCFGVGDGRVGCNDDSQPWRFDPLFAGSDFRVDSHNAHSQPNGGYHYHGPPNALYSNTNEAVSPVIGFAADGFPIFGGFVSVGGEIREAQSSYEVRLGQRPDTAGSPGGEYDGTYRDDYVFVDGSGDLDECNGMTVDGVYGYYVTQGFPYILGCFRGTADASFDR